MPNTPQWKLSRLASRVVRIHNRRKTGHPALEAFTSTLIPKAQTFAKAYNEAAQYETIRKKEVKEGRDALRDLAQFMRAWLPSFVRDIPGFSTRDFVDRPDVADDVIDDAERLVDAMAPREGFTPPSWSEAFDQALTAVLGAATKECQEAEAADANYQRLLQAVRETAAVFDAELRLYRAAFATTFGRKDKDYQRLRAERASEKDAEDEGTLAGGQEAGAPVPPGDPPTTA